MIAVTQAPATTTGSTPGTANPASTTPASPFDAILTLEALAATCAALDSAPLGGGALEGGSLEGLDENPGSDTDDADEDDQGGPLAFLVNLMNLSPPTTADVAGSADPVIDDALGGQAQRDADASAGAWVLPGTDSASNTDEGAAGKLLLTDGTLAANPVDGSSEDSKSTPDPTANIARAAEMLAQGPRHAVGAARDHIAPPAHRPRWADDRGARVAMRVRGAESTASLQLTPVDLGPGEVSVTVRDSQASIHFGAAQADTRALLEASRPKLREMLAAQGFNLMDASVSQGFSRQPRADVPGISRGAGSDPETEARATATVTALGLLDTYA